jgi:hypothetical protein
LAVTELRQRAEPIRSKAIRQAARGQRCTLNLPGICNYDPETVVLAHIHDDEFGKARKADDTSSMFACFACHTAYDTHRTGLSELDLVTLVLRAHFRTLRRLVLLEVVAVERDAPKSFSATPTPKRLPKEQRTKVRPSRGLQSSGRKIETRNDLRRHKGDAR